MFNCPEPERLYNLMTELYNSIFEWEVAATSFSDNSTVRTGLGLDPYIV